MQTLVIDTSYGSTVGVVGHEPIVETDSRTHVEKLQVNIAQAVEQAGLQASDITRIVVGVGPAPFTGLRAGIVAAKALAAMPGTYSNYGRSPPSDACRQRRASPATVFRAV